MTVSYFTVKLKNKQNISWRSFQSYSLNFKTPLYFYWYVSMFLHRAAHCALTLYTSRNTMHFFHHFLLQQHFGCSVSESLAQLLLPELQPGLLPKPHLLPRAPTTEGEESKPTSHFCHFYFNAAYYCRMRRLLGHDTYRTLFFSRWKSLQQWKQWIFSYSDVTKRLHVQ